MRSLSGWDLIGLERARTRTGKVKRDQTLKNLDPFVAAISIKINNKHTETQEIIQEKLVFRSQEEVLGKYNEKQNILSNQKTSLQQQERNRIVSLWNKHRPKVKWAAQQSTTVTAKASFTLLYGQTEPLHACSQAK